MSSKDEQNGHRGFGDQSRKVGGLAVHQEVPNEETEVETVGAVQDRSGDRSLAVRSSGRPEERTEGTGSRQKLAATLGRLTRRTLPALCNRRIRRGADKTSGKASETEAGDSSYV
jgi:hypothetical protein